MSKVDELRKECDLLNIRWHPRHKAETLQAKIDEHNEHMLDEAKANLETSGEEPALGFKCVALPDTEPEPAPPASTRKVHAERYEPPTKKEIPRDILDDLEYFSGKYISRTNRIRRYIESLL